MGANGTPGWEERRQSIWAVSAHVGRQLVDAVAPQPGETVLELGRTPRRLRVGRPERNPWAAKVAGVLVEHAHMAPPAEGAPGIFALADPAQIETLVLEAGFERPRIVEVAMTWRFESFDDYWAYTLEAAGALAMVIEQLPPHDREAVRAAVRDRVGPLADDGGELDGLCLNAFTTAPL